jgi:hypothetical protein
LASKLDETFGEIESGQKDQAIMTSKKLVTFVWYLGDGINKRHPLMRLMQALLDTVTDAMKK